MKPACEIAWIDSCPKHGDDKNTQAILGNRQRDSDGDTQCLVTSSTKQYLSQNYSCHKHHRAGSDAAAFLGDLNGEVGDGEEDAALVRGNSEQREQPMRSPSRPLLQKSDHGVEEKPRERDHTEQKEQRKQCGS